MPREYLYTEENSEEVQEIITSIPSWILRWGITLVFTILIGIVLMSALIEYPDVVRTNLKVNSLNSPKQVLAVQSGKLTKLLVPDGAMVKEKQLLAYFESTANADDILRLNKYLKKLQISVLNVSVLENLPTDLNLGELQGSYQNFHQEYLQYRSTQTNGYYLDRMAFINKDLKNYNALKSQIFTQQKVQLQEFANQQEEYRAYQKLYKNRVISRSEFTLQENKYLAAKYPLQQTETAILNNAIGYASKEKELFELKHLISDEKARFIQALNKCITDSDAWLLKYTLMSPVTGRLSYAGIVQENQNIAANQEVFVVNPGNVNFFGEVQIPQYNMGKIHLGNRTLIKMRSFPFEQYGMIRGRLTYISDVAYRDSVFIAKIHFDNFEIKDPLNKIVLKNGMQADAEIITEESTLLQRFFRNITKMMHGKE
ncbi:HlyD family secretion protein [Pedobacter miscanthi]|uniref:Secretion protein HlyD n=1 Tax=Pedobacter miscanthi TaxID=2259170 RepID=A0A366LC84_9SPHI|nr:HlyD family efflux transporter periplasmic adaptor subunit [Pedobacter miscanthi]RBQ11498.1 secretion protein HlyD [Pedobacter miscanthi]